MISSEKVPPNNRDNDQLRYSITILFSITHCQCTCICTIKANAKTTFLLVCRSNKYTDEKEKRECYCHSMSVYGAYFIIRFLQCRQSYNYIRFGRSYCYFRLLVVVRIIWGHFLWTRHDRKSQICRWNFDAVYRRSRDISTSGLGGHVATVAAAILTMTRWDIEFTC